MSDLFRVLGERSEPVRALRAGYRARVFTLGPVDADMSRNRDERGQFTEEVTLADVLAVFEEVEGPVVTSGDVASATGCSTDTARRKLRRLHDQGQLGRRTTAGRVVYWRLDGTPTPVDPEDPIFTDRPSFASGTENLSERVDELLYGEEA